MENPQVFPYEFVSGTVRKGMLLRDYFAGQAILGLVANPDVKPTYMSFSVDEERKANVNGQYSKIAYAIADAMLKEREKPLT